MMSTNNFRVFWKSNPILRYILVGAWNAMFTIALLYALLFWWGEKYYEMALGTNFIISSIQSYFSQKKLVWKSLDTSKSEIMRFFISAGMQYLLNSSLLFVLVHFLDFHPKKVAFVLMIFVTTFFYFVNKNLVFRKGEVLSEAT
jgi:hypothetical protein